MFPQIRIKGTGAGMKVEIISATRNSKEEFRTNSALGISLLRLSYDKQLIPRITASNSRGLPQIYNECLDSADEDSLVVFMHDDVWIDDYFFGQRIAEGLDHFDVIGVAGNRRRIPHQPGWPFVDRKFTWDAPQHLTGSVAHGDFPFGPVTHYGAAPASCELLDGLFMAAKKSVLKEKNVLFDPRFEFHFYDMDFCRTARQQGLTLGTWPICLTHRSPGVYGKEPWQKGYEAYIDKWGE